MSDRAGSDLTIDLDPALQPPMANGEVLFEQPWQGRVFAMAVSLHESGLFDWSEFQQTLIEVVGEWDAAAGADDPYHYYDHFQTALGRLLEAKRVLRATDVEQRARHYAQRPHGHDHGHDHS